MAKSINDADLEKLKVLVKNPIAVLAFRPQRLGQFVELVASVLARMENVEQENARLRTALNQIACWDEGLEVTASFDSPATVALAREALGSPPA